MKHYPARFLKKSYIILTGVFLVFLALAAVSRAQGLRAHHNLEIELFPAAGKLIGIDEVADRPVSFQDIAEKRVDLRNKIVLRAEVMAIRSFPVRLHASEFIQLQPALGKVPCKGGGFRIP